MARQRSRRSAHPPRWNDWEEVLSQIENEALKAFAREELDAGRECYLRKRGLHFRLNGKRRWTLHCRIRHAYVWQRGRFSNDVAFWKSRVSEPDSVKPVKAGRALAFTLLTKNDFDVFQEAATSGEQQTWIEVDPNEAATDEDDEIE